MSNIPEYFSSSKFMPTGETETPKLMSASDNPCILEEAPVLEKPSIERGTPSFQETQRYFAQMLIFLDHAKKTGDIARIFNLTSQALDIDRGYYIGIDRPRLSNMGSSRLHPGAGLFYDQRFAFVLLYSRMPLAVIAFGQDSNGIDVVQIQGAKQQRSADTKSAKKALYRLGSWGLALLELAEDYAQYCQIPTVKVQPAAENSWARNGMLNPEKAYERYDMAALARGYTFDAQQKRYIKQIEIDPLAPHLTLDATQLRSIILPFDLVDHENTDYILPSLNFYYPTEPELTHIKKGIFKQDFYSSIHKFIELKLEFDVEKYSDVNLPKMLKFP